ncbi:hypothetical protein ACFSHP_19635 [Novosphingobium panipatense]
MLAGVAMVIGIIWVNSGTSRNNGESALMTRNANADRPDSKARQVVAYEPPRVTGTGIQPPPQLVAPPKARLFRRLTLSTTAERDRGRAARSCRDPCRQCPTLYAGGLWRQAMGYAHGRRSSGCPDCNAGEHRREQQH